MSVAATARLRGLARLDAPTRVPGVDLARGLAVLGMIAAHLLATREFDLADPQTWTDVVNGRSSILFATLAGVSIGLVTGGPSPVRGAALRTAAFRLAARAVLLWLIGVLLIGTGVPIYNILPAYGLLFLLAIPFLALTARVLLPVAGALALVTPFLLVAVDAMVGAPLERSSALSIVLGWNYPALVWIAFVVAGLGLARADIRRRRTLLAAAGAGAVLAVVGCWGGAAAAALDAGPVYSSAPHSSGLFEVLGSGGVAIAAIAVCTLACRGAVARLVLPLRAVGSMPLTAYTLQVLAWSVAASLLVGRVGDLTAFRALHPFWPFAIGLVVVCTVWALAVGRGPLETLVDRIARVVVPAPAAADPRHPLRPDLLHPARHDLEHPVRQGPQHRARLDPQTSAPTTVPPARRPDA